MQEQLIEGHIEKFRDFKDFKKKTQVGRFWTYDLEYHNKTTGLMLLEHFAEGEYRVGPIKVTRKYISIGSFPEKQKLGMGDSFIHYTKVELPEGTPIAQIGLVHGFGESSDGWLESAYIYALNGMLVHAID